MPVFCSFETVSMIGVSSLLLLNNQVGCSARICS